MQEIVFSVIGSSAFTMILTWVLYFRKHAANANGLEKSNDKTEIENQKELTKEWRETATQWKDLADQYQKELIALSGDLTSQVKGLNQRLVKANKRIAELENA